MREDKPRPRRALGKPAEKPVPASARRRVAAASCDVFSAQPVSPAPAAVIRTVLRDAGFRLGQAAGE